MGDKLEQPFNTETIKELVKVKFSDPKTKISDDAITALAELMRVTTVEIALRAGVQAKREASHCVLLDHIEKILPQVTLTTFEEHDMCSVLHCDRNRVNLAGSALYKLCEENGEDILHFTRLSQGALLEERSVILRRFFAQRSCDPLQKELRMNKNL